MPIQITTEFKKLESSLYARFSAIAGEPAMKAFISAIEDYQKKVMAEIEKSEKYIENLREENDLLRSICGASEFDIKSKIIEQGANIRFLQEQVLLVKKEAEAKKKKQEDLLFEMEVRANEEKIKLRKKDEVFEMLEKDFNELKDKIKHLSDAADKNKNDWAKERRDLLKKNENYERHIKKTVYGELNVLFDRIRNLSGVVSSTAQFCQEKWGQIKGETLRASKKRFSLIGPSKPLSEISPDLQVIHDFSQKLLNTVDLYTEMYEVPKPKWEKISWQGFFGKLKRKYFDALVKRQMTITWPEEKKYPQTLSDENIIAEVIDIVLNNAFEAIKGKGIMDVSGVFTEDKVVLSIFNNGPVIPENERDKIFVPFFTTKSNHNGLGLPHAVKLMDVLYGTIKYEPKENGSVFVVTIPSNK